eukprot:Phypoly_transcript_09958.p1 GENE.Phypoly_transcript_09958~~Phypoly_transcript_09958.p1  ORF type:complete len:307 (+),score=14.40 Phypoly_transcript_09958:184-1104(+)
MIGNNYGSTTKLQALFRYTILYFVVLNIYCRMIEDIDDGSTTKLHVYYVIQFIYCSLTVMGCLMAMFCILIVWRSCQILIKMVFFLVFSNFFIGLIGFLSSPFIGVWFSDNKKLCTVQGVAFFFFEKAGWMWISSMALFMVIIVRGTSEAKLNRMLPLVHLVCWGVSFSLSVPFFPYVAPIETFDGKRGHWCAMGKSNLIIPALFLPLVVLFVFNLICVIYILVKLYFNYKTTQEVYTKLLSTRRSYKIRKFFFRLVAIPIIFMLCYSGDISARILELFKINSSLDLQFVALFIWLEGFLKYLVYV